MHYPRGWGWGEGGGFTKWLSQVSEITENHILHGNMETLSWKSLIKSQKQGIHDSTKYVTETSYCITNIICDRKESFHHRRGKKLCHRKKFISNNNKKIREHPSLKKQFLSEKLISVQVSVQETHFRHKKCFCRRKKIPAINKASFRKNLPSQKQVDRILICEDIVFFFTHRKFFVNKFFKKSSDTNKFHFFCCKIIR